MIPQGVEVAQSWEHRTHLTHRLPSAAQRSKSDGKSPPEPRSRPQAVQPEQLAGCWYLAGGPPVAYLAPVPVVPYGPSLL